MLVTEEGRTDFLSLLPLPNLNVSLPSLGPISFIFMQFSAKPCQIVCLPPLRLAPQGLGNPESATVSGSTVRQQTPPKHV